MSRVSKKRREELIEIFREYQRELGNGPPTVGEAVQWGIETGRLDDSGKALATYYTAEMSSALQSETFVDQAGRLRRTFHCAIQTYMHPETGKPVTRHEWQDYMNASREFMLVSFTQRERQIESDAKKLISDVDGYNEDVALPRGDRQIQLRFAEWFRGDEGVGAA